MTGEHSGVLMLLLGRVDLLAGNPLVLKHQLQAEELKGKILWDDLEEVCPLIQQDDYYMAFSLNTAQETVNRARAAFQKLQAQGLPEKIYRDYLLSGE